MTNCTCPSGDGSLRWPCPAHPPMDELAPQGRFEISVELRFAEYELQRAAGAFLARDLRARGHGCMVDATTLGVIRERLDAGTTTPAMAGLFLDAARTMLGRVTDELGA